MVFDDGVTTRLGEHHFQMTTTTGGAARVMAWLEELAAVRVDRIARLLHQRDRAVGHCRHQRAARAQAAGGADRDIDLDPATFPFMSFRDGKVAGVPARVYRISFTGELNYEVNVAPSYALALWQALMQAGEKYGITPYGTEAMHVLRAEKGFVIVGQETDGTVTPHDLGMDWIVSKKKPDFLGKRSLPRRTPRGRTASTWSAC